jgi:hypothetical protein
MTRSAFWLLCAGLALGGAADARAEPLEQALRRLPDAGWRSATPGLVREHAIDEISGLAGSRRDPSRLWAINDSDNGALLHLVDGSGRLAGSWTVDGAENYDWEDLAAFVDGGQPWLLIADTGDNGGLRAAIDLVAVREPDVAAPPASVPVAWKLRVTWPDGPRDCEAVAVDVAAREILLIAKKRVPAQVFRVPLPTVDQTGTIRAVAEPIAIIPGIPQPTEQDLAAAPAGLRYMSQVTAADLSPDGRSLLLLTYREAYLMTRRAGEPWRDALLREPQRLRMPPLVQAEAIAFDRDGRAIWIGTEKLPAPLIHLVPR